MAYAEVIVTRNTTESATVIVKYDPETEDPNDVALGRVGKHGHDWPIWELDDQPGEPYIPDPDNYRVLDDGAGELVLPDEGFGELIEKEVMYYALEQKAWVRGTLKYWTDRDGYRAAVVKVGEHEQWGYFGDIRWPA